MTFKEYYSYVMDDSVITSIIFDFLSTDEIEKIKVCLNDLSISYRRVARNLDISVQFVSDIMNRKRKPILKFYLFLKFIGLDLISIYLHDLIGYICNFDNDINFDGSDVFEIIK